MILAAVLILFGLFPSLMLDTVQISAVALLRGLAP
jgi:hypothetical protein